MIKAVFFDVDGTLISMETRTVPESTKRSLKALQEKGIKIFLATGRHKIEIQQLLWDDFSFDGYLSLNGQLCLDGDFNVFFGNPICKEGEGELRSLFAKKQVPFYLTQENTQRINFVDDLTREICADIDVALPEKGEPEDSPIYQATAFFSEGDTDCWFVNHCPTGCKITRWCDGAADILVADGSKVTGIEKSMEYFGFAQEETMAFGDASNDIEMLRFAAIGVCMGNGKDEAKAAADYVTASVDDDGIEKALQHFGLI